MNHVMDFQYQHDGVGRTVTYTNVFILKDLLIDQDTRGEGDGYTNVATILVRTIFL